MNAHGVSIACTACQHEIGSSASGIHVKAKALDCNHNLCSECFSARIRILAKDKIMILKCPVSSCKRITTRPLPVGFCGNVRKPTVRRNMGSNVKTRSKSCVKEHKRQVKKDVLLEQFTDVPVSTKLPTSPQSVMHTDIEWLIYGIKVLYTVLILAVGGGFVAGFETVFSNPIAHLDNPFSSIVLPGLVAILLVAEFVPEDVLLAHSESIKWVKICDLLLILVLSVTSCRTVHFGATHALGQYLSMSLGSHFLALLVMSVLVLKVISILYTGLLWVGAASTKLYTSVRHSSYIVRKFGLPRVTTPAITKPVDSVFCTPIKKHTTRSTSTPSSTVRTIGLAYDSRYVCAPLLSIDYLEYSELTDYSEVSEQSPLAQGKSNHNTHSNHPDYSNSVTTTLSTIDDCDGTLDDNNIHTTINTNNLTNITTTADVSPTDNSDTTTDIIVKVSMNMLVDGYPWDEGVTFTNTTTNITTNTTTNHAYDSVTTSVVPSTKTCVIYSDIEGVGVVKDEIVNYIAFQPTVTEPSEVQVDTTPVEFTTQAEDNINHHEDTNNHHEDTNNHHEDTTESAERNVMSDSDIDIAYALNCIYINPNELELSMEKECIEEEEGDLKGPPEEQEEYTFSMFPSPSTYNPIHSTCTMDSNGHLFGVHSGNHSPTSSSVDNHSLQYSESNRSTPVTPCTPMGTRNTPNYSDTNTTLVTPYITTSLLDNVNTVDVYNNPTPVFRVPKNPSPNQDLFVSPVETPIKSMDGSTSVTNTPAATTTTTSAITDINTSTEKLITSITSMYAPVYVTPTKSIRSQWQNNNNTPKTANMYTYNSSVLHSPLFTTSTSTSNTPSAESPDDEFRLRSNIKLKPLGRLSFGASDNTTTNDINSVVSSNGSGEYTAKPSTYDNFVDHPISPEPTLGTHTTHTNHTNHNNHTNATTKATIEGTTSTTRTSKQNSANYVVNSTNSMQATKETSTTTKTNKNTINTTNKEKKGNTQSMPRWKGILGPSVNLIR